MMAAPFTLRLSSRATRETACRAVMQAPEGSSMSIALPKRTGDQNRLLHALLTDVALQVEWNGKKRNVEAWKDIFTAALRSANHELDIVPGLHGGFVLLGMHTSSMSKEEMSDLIELMYAFGAQRGVVWSEPAEIAA